MVLIGDESKGNLDRNVDGHIVGEKFLCEKGCIAKIKATRKEKHFTVIGLKNLLVEPICCIVIVGGKGHFLILGLALIYLRRKWEMIVTENDNFE